MAPAAAHDPVSVTHEIGAMKPAARPELMELYPNPEVKGRALRGHATGRRRQVEVGAFDHLHGVGRSSEGSDEQSTRLFARDSVS